MGGTFVPQPASQDLRISLSKFLVSNYFYATYNVGSPWNGFYTWFNSPGDCTNTILTGTASPLVGSSFDTHDSFSATVNRFLFLKCKLYTDGANVFLKIGYDGSVAPWGWYYTVRSQLLDDVGNIIPMTSITSTWL